jgi:hypothetical protein
MIEAMKMALEALTNPSTIAVQHAIALLQKELAKPEQAEKQEPVAWMEMVVANLVRNGINKHMARELAHYFYTYTAPPRKPWISLDEVELTGMTCECVDDGTFNMKCAIDLGRVIETKLKELNK